MKTKKGHHSKWHLAKHLHKEQSFQRLSLWSFAIYFITFFGPFFKSSETMEWKYSKGPKEFCSKKDEKYFYHQIMTIVSCLHFSVVWNSCGKNWDISYFLAEIQDFWMPSFHSFSSSIKRYHSSFLVSILVVFIPSEAFSFSLHSAKFLKLDFRYKFFYYMVKIFRILKFWNYLNLKLLTNKNI